MAVAFHLYVASHPDDGDFVRPLVAALKAEGWRVFDEAHNLSPGDDSEAQIERGIAGSAWFVLVRGARDRDDARRALALTALEARRADPAGTRVLPIDLVAPTPPDARYSKLNLLQALSAQDRDAARAAAAIDKLARKQGAPVVGPADRARGRLGARRRA